MTIKKSDLDSSLRTSDDQLRGGHHGRAFCQQMGAPVENLDGLIEQEYADA